MRVEEQGQNSIFRKLAGHSHTEDAWEESNLMEAERPGNCSSQEKKPGLVKAGACYLEDGNPE